MPALRSDARRELRNRSARHLSLDDVHLPIPGARAVTGTSCRARAGTHRRDLTAQKYSTVCRGKSVLTQTLGVNPPAASPVYSYEPLAVMMMRSDLPSPLKSPRT